VTIAPAVFLSHGSPMVALGAAGEDRPASIFEGFHHGSLGMRSIEFRAA
jgi:aromatic ring-opening dioxygenase catalytic subunit (LigB family)